MFSPQLTVTVSSARVWGRDLSTDSPRAQTPSGYRHQSLDLFSSGCSLSASTPPPGCHGLYPVGNHGSEAAAGSVSQPARQQDGGGGGRVQHQPHSGLHLLQHQSGTLPAAARAHVSRSNGQDQILVYISSHCIPLHSFIHSLIFCFFHHGESVIFKWGSLLTRRDRKTRQKRGIFHVDLKKMKKYKFLGFVSQQHPEMDFLN